MTMWFFQALNNKNVLNAVTQDHSTGLTIGTRSSSMPLLQLLLPLSAKASLGVDNFNFCSMLLWALTSLLLFFWNPTTKIFEPFYAIVEDKKITQIFSVKIFEALWAHKLKIGRTIY